MLVRALTTLLVASLAWIAMPSGCTENAYCEGSYLHLDTNEPGSYHEAMWLCSALCSECGFGGGSASCVETDDYAHCDCGGPRATFCERANEEGKRCNQDTCD